MPNRYTKSAARHREQGQSRYADALEQLGTVLDGPEPPTWGQRLVEAWRQLWRGEPSPRARSVEFWAAVAVIALWLVLAVLVW
jgi:ABC-type branched-subunit amino acid transport system substrate-binding protein